MSTMLLLGAGVGLGVWCVAYGLRPPRADLQLLLARLQPTSPQPTPLRGPPPASAATGWDRAARRVGRPIAGLLGRLGYQLPARDLAVTGRSAERLAAQQATLGLLGLLLPPALAGLLIAVGGTLPGLLPWWVGIALAAGGWLLPLLRVKQHATIARQEVRHTLGAYLDLTVIALAGGAGVEGALHDAAQPGTDWASAELRHALQTARLRGQPPWAALGELGEQLGVGELEELAASISLAGTQGARVRGSLAAKAASVRAHQHAQLEADAHAATERMALPLVCMLAGFLLFIGFPAVMSIVNPP